MGSGTDRPSGGSSSLAGYGLPVGAVPARDLRITAVLYLLTTLAMATIGLVVPFIDNLVGRLRATPGEIGWAIALFSLPSAIFSIAGGEVVDRLGVRRGLLIFAAIALLADLVLILAPGIAWFCVGLALAGIAFAGVSISAPAALMTMMDGGARTRALSFWSTYAPTGYALGLLMTIPFATAGEWTNAVLLHLIVTGLSIPLIATLPRATAARGRIAHPGRRILTLLSNIGVVRLALAVALPNAISYGTSLAAPAYLARAHMVGLALSSGTVAAAKIGAMLVGGALMGHLLTRDHSYRRLYIGLALTGIVAQILLFSPGTSFAVAAFGLLLWLFAFGGMAGTATAQLPAFVADEAEAGIASGLLGQFISILSFAAPPIYLAVPDWRALTGLAAAGLVTAMLLLPGGAAAVRRER